MNLSRIEWAIGYLLLLAALVVCLVPNDEVPTPFALNDKLSHMIGHGGLAVYFSGLVARRGWWKIFVFLLLFGGAIELAQHFMHAGRQGDPRDLAANSLGALLGLGAGWAGLARWPEWLARILGQPRATP